jgi:hypothetical protein
MLDCLRSTAIVQAADVFRSTATKASEHLKALNTAKSFKPTKVAAQFSELLYDPKSAESIGT